MSDYIHNNKVLGAKEVLPPSLEQEYSLAVNFNRETVNSVLNYAKDSKIKMINSKSLSNLNPATSTEVGESVYSKVSQ